VLFTVAKTFVGAPSAAVGITALEVAEGLLAPTLLAAVTVNVYAIPLVRPVTVAVIGPVRLVAVSPPGLAVTV